MSNSIEDLETVTIKSKSDQHKNNQKAAGAIIGLCLTNFLLKIGLFIETTFTLIAKNKIISILTVSVIASSSANVYLAIENQQVKNELTECKEKCSTNTESTISSSTVTTFSTDKPCNCTEPEAEVTVPITSTQSVPSTSPTTPSHTPPIFTTPANESISWEPSWP
uniref:CSON003600 protein n=1 Tax=Culicoides sonorensis TaxID=179676 RepID=A0A336MLW2_CULSO